MTTVFAVIGAHRDDPDNLLLRGDDGRHYTWSSPDQEPAPWADDASEPDDMWQIDVSRSEEEGLFL
ncbi:MAG TPA: hypothetical protein VGT61_00600 [Thermomicrobiales bacterium]|nr:hypothetical protein [Thermomicrobiales bacterium]